MPTKKPRVAITLSEEEKVLVGKIASKFGMTEAALCSYCVRRFLADFKGDPLQPISDGMVKQLNLEIDL